MNELFVKEFSSEFKKKNFSSFVPFIIILCKLT